MLSQTPENVLKILEKLDEADRDAVKRYIYELESKLGMDTPTDAPSEQAEKPDSAEKASSEQEDDFPPLYESGEDYDAAAERKQEASNHKSAGKWGKAVESYTAAILLAPPSALLYANRAHALLKTGRFAAAERDCNQALESNPDSAKALRVRGKARKAMEKWEAALKDLSASQQIDFDEDTVEDLKFLAEKRVEAEKEEAAERNEQEEKKRKRAEEIRKAQEDAVKEEAERAREAAAGGMPGTGGMPGMGGMGGMPGGMPGMGGMPGGMAGLASLFSDPEVMNAMKNPKFMQAAQEMMSGGAPDPAKLQEYMSDPDIGPVIQKLMAKMGQGGAPAASGPDDGIPNMDDMGDGGVDLDDLPDLE